MDWTKFRKIVFLLLWNLVPHDAGGIYIVFWYILHYSANDYILGTFMGFWRTSIKCLKLCCPNSFLHHIFTCKPISFNIKMLEWLVVNWTLTYKYLDCQHLIGLWPFLKGIFLNAVWFRRFSLLLSAIGWKEGLNFINKVAKQGRERKLENSVLPRSLIQPLLIASYFEHLFWLPVVINYSSEDKIKLFLPGCLWSVFSHSNRDVNNDRPN